MIYDAMPKKLSWTCFHCGETFTNEESARTHFGRTECDTAACVIAAHDGGLVMKMREAEQRADEQLERALQAERDLEAAQCQIDSLSTAMRSYAPFKNCRSINDVFFVYDSMEGRALAAEEQLRNFSGL
jgi:phage terminase large subunit GpA-like protein